VSSWEQEKAAKRAALLQREGELIKKIETARAQMVVDSAERCQIVADLCMLCANQQEAANLIGVSTARVTAMVSKAKQNKEKRAREEFNARLYNMRAAAHVTQLRTNGGGE